MAYPANDVSGHKVHQPEMGTSPSHVEAHLEKLRNYLENTVEICIQFQNADEKYSGNKIHEADMGALR